MEREENATVFASLIDEVHHLADNEDLGREVADVRSRWSKVVTSLAEHGTRLAVMQAAWVEVTAAAAGLDGLVTGARARMADEPQMCVADSDAFKAVLDESQVRRGEAAEACQLCYI